MSRFTNEANVPLAVAGITCLVVGIVCVFAVIAGYRSQTLLESATGLIIIGMVGVVAGSRLR
jgi:hypothetical protein